MLEDIMGALGFVRQGAQRAGQVWEAERPCGGCGSRLTHDDGTGFTCVECGMWRTGGSGYVRRVADAEGP
ncbi:hypothetical protein LCGC14_1490220 [marine sediment metagenome]|uniref:Uncharacterized protein n=1 Tax=marine sediment metagenome TaxID=412755 RepID=A0A0F9LMG1_9ZZZZ